jgi:molybdopterin converting factor small subunit
LLNGRNIYFLEGLQTELKDGDQIFIRPAAAGG